MLASDAHVNCDVSKWDRMISYLPCCSAHGGGHGWDNPAGRFLCHRSVQEPTTQPRTKDLSPNLMEITFANIEPHAWVKGPSLESSDVFYSVSMVLRGADIEYWGPAGI